jgi:hypothetical protein
MQNTDNLTGQLARLPDGQRVIVESQDGVPTKALVRRIGGSRAGTLAICPVSLLELLDWPKDKKKC